MNVRLAPFAMSVALFVSLVAACASSHDGPPARDPEDASIDAEVPGDAATPEDAGQTPDGAIECIPLGEPCTDVTDCCGYHPPAGCGSELFQCEGTCSKYTIPC